MSDSLAANQYVALVAFDLSPHRRRSLRVLRKAAHVGQLALFRNLGECSAIFLGYGNEFSPAGTRPAPGACASPGRAPELGMSLEIKQIQVLASKSVLGVALDI